MTNPGFVFSTFAMRRAECAVQRIAGFAAAAAPLIATAATVVSMRDDTFYYPAMGETLSGLERTRQIHYASYIEGVASARLATQVLGPCACAAGYSMGLYAALCHLEAIDFEAGLRLMDTVCVTVHDAMSDDYAIGAVEGLVPAELRAAIAATAPAVEVVDQYGPVTLVPCGRSSDVQAVLAAAERAGAVYTRLMPATAPYHTSALRKVEGRLREAVLATPVRAPRAVLYSALNQQPLSTAEAVREELSLNVMRPMNWLATTRALAASGIDSLCECGSSQSLGNMAMREVPGAYQVQSLPELAATAAS